MTWGRLQSAAGFSPPLGFGFLCGRQSCLQAVFQAAVFDISANFSGFCTCAPAIDEVEKNRAEALRRLKSAPRNGQSPAAGFSPPGRERCETCGQAD
jgi:hypothetical protein